MPTRTARTSTSAQTETNSSIAVAVPFDPAQPTPLSLNDWHRAACIDRPSQIVRRIACADGFTMSVQASSGHYCSPREDKGWPYSAFEIGYPSRKEQLITKYAESPGQYTDTVYGWVPVDVVEAVIAKHGGLKAGA
jgi:hypothetical protein